MIISWVISAVSAFGFMLVLLFFMGDPKEVLETPTGWPIIQIIFQATRTVHGANALMSVFLLTSIVSYFNSVASVVRLTWAFGMLFHLNQPYLFQPRLTVDDSSRRWFAFFGLFQTGMRLPP